MGCVEFCDKVQQTLPNTYSLIIGENYKTANPIVMCFHADMCHSDKGNGLFVIQCYVASDSGAKFAV
ncbi:MAG: hypothetical protein ABSA33_05120 [Candidatus Micrarchaeaceae archaeon]